MTSVSRADSYAAHRCERLEHAMDLLTPDEVAELLRTSPGTLRYWRHVGIGPPSFKLGRRVKYRRADLEAWVDAQHDAAVA